MPPFVSSEVQMVIQVAYAPGDKFQIGYKALEQESYEMNTYSISNEINTLSQTPKENWTNYTKKRKTKTTD